MHGFHYSVTLSGYYTQSLADIKHAKRGGRGEERERERRERRGERMRERERRGGRGGGEGRQTKEDTRVQGKHNLNSSPSDTQNPLLTTAHSKDRYLNNSGRKKKKNTHKPNNFNLP